MTRLETNIFPITNLNEISSNYKLYRIKGLYADQNEYYQNCQTLKRKLSYKLQKPVTTIEREGIPYLVVRDDASDPPSPFPLVRTTVHFEPCQEIYNLDYNLRSPENDEICQRFLQFLIQAPFYKNSELWQPRSGQAFFKKKSINLKGNVLKYEGFSVRAAITPDGGMGLCVDVTSKYVSRSSLPLNISRDEFSKWKEKHAIYHYGHQWYEIRICGLSDQNVAEYQIRKNNEWVHLLDYVIADSRKPIPPELAQVPHNTSVVLYKNNRDEERAAPTSLCYPVYGTDDQEAGSQHQSTILPPHIRRHKIQEFVREYLLNLQFGDTRIHVSHDPVSISPRMFTVPDYEFGGSKILSVRGTPGTQHVSLDNLGKTRLALLKDRGAGFYESDAFGSTQYFIVPRSIFESYGPYFLADLKNSVNDFFHQKDGYAPVVVPYNDRVAKTFVSQGKEILNAVEAQCQRPGYGVVMIHHIDDREIRQEDQLAAMVTRELRDRFDLCVAVIHSTVGRECYERVNPQNGAPHYQPHRNARGRLTGYLRNVAINKVLLTNQRWPFVLATPLHADITIGIDVKYNTAGLIVVGSNGAKIRPMFKTSRQKEKLLEDQMAAYLVEIIRKEADARVETIRTIVVHRDGRTYDTEIRGEKRALALLKEKGIIDSNATLTLLEIHKTSFARFRLFDVINRNSQPWVKNPQIGMHCIVNNTEGYLCSTGRAFPRPGTVQPLHIKRVDGTLPIEKCFEDIYYLTALAWTRPEDCTRYPITIKLNDRYLGEEATEYDAEALEFKTTLEEEVIV